MANNSLSWKNNFYESYLEYCKIENSAPCLCILRLKDTKTLTFFTDKIETKDWKAILAALALDRFLHNVDVKSSKYYKEGYAMIKSLMSSEILSGLLLSLTETLKMSKALKRICFSGLEFFSLKHVLILEKGIFYSNYLEEISFENSKIGDDVCAAMCHTLKKSTSVKVVNLSNCDIGSRGIAGLCSLIEHHIMNCQVEAWHNSLRFNKDKVRQGLREITLNNNEDIGSGNTEVLLNSLMKDSFIEIVNLENCSIGIKCISSFIDLLKTNLSLQVVNVQNNSELPSFVQCDINEIIKYDLAMSRSVLLENSQLVKMREQQILARCSNISAIHEHVEKYKLLILTQKKMDYFVGFKSCLDNKCEIHEETLLKFKHILKTTDTFLKLIQKLDNK